MESHGCVELPFEQWHPACQGVLHRYVEAELHLDLWHCEAVAGCVLLIVGSICSYGIVGPRTGVDVIMDGARYMQVSCSIMIYQSRGMYITLK